ncbi:unnamed protein product [Cuscuta europaea]|uniref:Uncharacterized protein n=1 Tax=Cuscuta europaea TaxID=41803 RepID=A0A9P0ZJF9_CUSEU|nr:unnamed protein product [Cuscuta europaea]
MDHLLDCTNKLFRSKGHNKCFPAKVKILTAVLKFIVDAISMEFAHLDPHTCMKFALEYVQFISSCFRKYSLNQLQLKEEGMHDTLLCVNSSFTYGAKLINLVLKNLFDASTPQLVAYHLANELLNLTVCIEHNMGHSHATRLLSAANPWIPDLILAFGSFHMMNHQIAVDSESVLPSWLSVLARIELFELQGSGSDEEQTETVTKETDFLAFKKLMGTVVKMLRANHGVLDGFGTTVLNILLIRLQSRDFNVVLGLLHFICVKLIKDDDLKQNELKKMLASLQQINHQIESESENSSNSEDELQVLQSAKTFIESVLNCSSDSPRKQ